MDGIFLIRSVSDQGSALCSFKMVRRRWWKIAVGAAGFGPMWVTMFLSKYGRDWFVVRGLVAFVDKRFPFLKFGSDCFSSEIDVSLGSTLQL